VWCATTSTSEHVREEKIEPRATLSISSPFASASSLTIQHHRELRHDRARSSPHHRLPNPANSSATLPSTASTTSLPPSNPRGVTLGTPSPFRPHRSSAMATAMWPAPLRPFSSSLALVLNFSSPLDASVKTLPKEMVYGSQNRAVSFCALAASVTTADGHPLWLPLSKPFLPSLASA
jgi:hypothetical protein